MQVSNLGISVDDSFHKYRGAQLSGRHSLERHIGGGRGEFGKIPVARGPFVWGGSGGGIHRWQCRELKAGVEVQRKNIR